LHSDADAEHLIHLRSDHTFLILNRYPYNNGHLMVVPNAHQASIEHLDPTTLSELMMLASLSVKLLRKVYGADAFNMGMNIGEPAGAGVAEHVHLHILPRWAGDTNFMTTTTATRVIPEALESTYARLQTALQSLLAEQDLDANAHATT
jgi:ATP adenylyltransferase